MEKNNKATQMAIETCDLCDIQLTIHVDRTYWKEGDCNVVVCNSCLKDAAEHGKILCDLCDEYSLNSTKYFKLYQEEKRQGDEHRETMEQLKKETEELEKETEELEKEIKWIHEHFDVISMKEKDYFDIID